jgi:hypothetical protein
MRFVSAAKAHATPVRHMPRLLVHQARRTGSTVVHKLPSPEQALSSVLYNPGAATTVATVKVLSNPFRKDPVSGKESYASMRRYSNFVVKIDNEVTECQRCYASQWGIKTKWHQEGQVTFGDRDKVYLGDTFCEDHKDKALKAQRIIRHAGGM